MGTQYRYVVSGSTYYFLTAGRCGNVEPTWYTIDGDFIGVTVASSFPADDSAILAAPNGGRRLSAAAVL